MNKMNDENFLVSVVVVTYRSSQTILETLESIKSQSYNNIELVITDDNSPDDTLIICKKWITDNSKRFVRIELLASNQNTGTSANLNRGVRICKGLWVKPIAGDDKLLPNCIQDNLSFVFKNPNSEIVFSRVRMFGSTHLLEDNQSLFKYQYFKLPHDKFYAKLIQRNFLPAPSAFIKRSVFGKIGFYDESIPLVEDWPFWMKAYKYGCLFVFFDEETVEYRVQGSASIASTKSSKYDESEDAAYRLSFKYQKEFSKKLLVISVIKRYWYVIKRQLSLV